MKLSASPCHVRCGQRRGAEVGCACRRLPLLTQGCPAMLGFLACGATRCAHCVRSTQTGRRKNDVGGALRALARNPALLGCAQAGATDPGPPPLLKRWLTAPGFPRTALTLPGAAGDRRRRRCLRRRAAQPWAGSARSARPTHSRGALSERSALRARSELRRASPRRAAQGSRPPGAGRRGHRRRRLSPAAPRTEPGLHVSRAAPECRARPCSAWPHRP